MYITFQNKGTGYLEMHLTRESLCETQGLPCISKYLASLERK